MRRPTTSQRLLLRAAVLSDAAACSAWREWRRAGGDIDSVGPASFRLLALVYRNLEACGVADPDLPRLRGVYRHAWVTNQRMLHRLWPVIEALADARIPTLTLGGPAVTIAHYRDAGARRMDDVGLLVHPADAVRAIGVLRAAGLAPTGRLQPERVLRTGHAVSLGGGDAFAVQLRSHALPGSAGDEDFWTGAVVAALDSMRVHAPGPAEQLLNACTDGLRRGPAAFTWITDAARILGTSGDEISWERLVQGAARRGLTLTTGVALTIVRELVSAPVPDGVLAELHALPRGARERLVLELAGRRGLGAECARLWDAYRRRPTIASGEHARRGFLTFVADVKGLPSRRGVAHAGARRAIASTAGRARLQSRRRTAAVSEGAFDR